MGEIILSFFSVIGIIFLIIYIADYLFYRNFKQIITLTVDTRNMTMEQCIDTFELICSVRQNTSGKAVSGSIIVIVSDKEPEKAKLAGEFIRIFHLPGKVEIVSDENE